MTRTFRAAIAATLILAGAASPAQVSPAHATSRIKDLANIEGVRQNQLIGYGLVVGLNGTGDTLNNIPFTRQSLQAMLERLGVNIRGQQIRTGNVAAVMVTANLPAFGTQGTRIDVTVSALGDSKSLQGGTLLVTPLLGADGNVYAVAQGSLAISGFQAEGEAAKIVRGVPTVGRISNGAIIEREIEFALNRLGQVRLALRNPDFTTARAHRVGDQRLHRLADRGAARSVDRAAHHPAEVPGQRGRAAHRDRAVAGRARSRRQGRDRRALRHHRDGPRRARLHGRGGARQSHRHDLGDAAGLASRSRSRAAQTRVVPRTRVGVQEDGKRLALVREGVSLQQLVDGLNALGIGPRDLISILQAIKAAGAIQADIEVM